MINPYENIVDLKAFKGDVHIHTDKSDGIGSLDEMLHKLIACQFDFCSITDHDMPGTVGVKDHLLILPGQELSDDNGHIVALASEIDRTDYETTSAQLKAVNDSGGFSILSHPNIREFVPVQSLTYTASRLVNELEGLYKGIEIYTNNVGSGLKLAIDRLDVVWTAGLRRNNLMPVWAFANSDGHAVDHITENVGIMVWAEQCDQDAILSAICHGRFYSLANTKSRIERIEFMDNRLYISAQNAVLIRIIKSAGLPVKTVSSANPGVLELAYDAIGDEGYLRVEVMDTDGHCAYSNPMQVPCPCDDNTY